MEAKSLIDIDYSEEKKLRLNLGEKILDVQTKPQKVCVVLNFTTSWERLWRIQLCFFSLVDQFFFLY